MAGFITNPFGKEFHHSQQSDTCFLRLDQMRVSCIPKPSQTESLHWVTCLLIAQPETSWTRMYLLELITPQQDQSVQDTWWASRQPVHQREQYHLRAFHPPSTCVILYLLEPLFVRGDRWQQWELSDSGSFVVKSQVPCRVFAFCPHWSPHCSSRPRGRLAGPTSGSRHCAWSQCSHPKASSFGGCACAQWSPSLALLELSFKRVFIIRIVTMEEFFLLSILIYLKTTLTWKISEHFSIPSFIKYYT